MPYNCLLSDVTAFKYFNQESIVVFLPRRPIAEQVECKIFVQVAVSNLSRLRHRRLRFSKRPFAEQQRLSRRVDFRVELNAVRVKKKKTRVIVGGPSVTTFAVSRFDVRAQVFFCKSRKLFQTSSSDQCDRIDSFRIVYKTLNPRCFRNVCPPAHRANSPHTPEDTVARCTHTKN